MVATADGGPGPVQATAAVCPAGERVLGSGARIEHRPGDRVGLQVTRASGTGDISRAQAQRDSERRDRVSKEIAEGDVEALRKELSE